MEEWLKNEKNIRKKAKKDEGVARDLVRARGSRGKGLLGWERTNGV